MDEKPCTNCPPPTETECPSVIGWYVWADDGRVYSSLGHHWIDVPDDGILGIVLFQSTRAPGGQRTRQLISSYDTYFEATDRLNGQRFIAGSNDPGDEVADRYIDAVVKRGRWASTETIHRIIDEMSRAAWVDD